MDRRERILADLPKGLGLEIGASYQPIALGDPNLQVKSLDHLDQAALVAKFSKFSQAAVDVSRIQPVDYVWSGQRYLDLVGDTRFDWILASHVVEHVPDLVAFINECGEILQPGGVLSLMVPDRRREFDYYRPCAGLGAVVDAHLQNRRLSSPGLAAEFSLYMSQLDGRDTWTADDSGTPTLRHEDWKAKSLMERARSGEYVDIHAWVFTPHSFRLLIEDLHNLGLLTLRESAFRGGDDHEFHIQLSADGKGPGLSRAELCNLVLEEQRAMDAPSGAPQPAPAPEPGPQPAPASVDLGRHEALKAENLSLRQEVEALRASTSWRVTAPMRALKSMVAP